MINVTYAEDCRVRFGGEILPGDECVLRSGAPGVVTNVVTSDGRLIVFAAPAELVDRTHYLSGAAQLRAR